MHSVEDLQPLMGSATSDAFIQGGEAKVMFTLPRGVSCEKTTVLVKNTRYVVDTLLYHGSTISKDGDPGCRDLFQNSVGKCCIW